MDNLYIQKVLNGDTNAFRFFIKNYKDIAYSLAISVVKDEFIAQDVVQTSFINAFSHLHTFKGKSKFSTWLYKIIINEAFKTFKKHEKEIIRFEELPTEINTVEFDNSILRIEEDEQRYFINEALKKLSPKESLALRLFYLEECSIEEITEITGWTGSNIKVILFRARTNLRLALKNCFNLDKQAFYQ